MNNSFNNDSFRLFLGSYIDRIIVVNFYNELSAKLSKSVKGKLVEPNNFHFTYQFLGDCNKRELVEIKELLNPYFTEYNSILVLKGISAFPNKINPNVIYLNIENQDKKVIEIQSEMSKILAGLGFKADYKKFVPHITLIRIKEIIDKSALSSFFDEYSDHNFGSQDSFRMNLIQSTLTPKGPIYKILK